MKSTMLGAALMAATHSGADSEEDKAMIELMNMDFSDIEKRIVATQGNVTEDAVVIDGGTRASDIARAELSGTDRLTIRGPMYHAELDHLRARAESPRLPGRATARAALAASVGLIIGAGGMPPSLIRAERRKQLATLGAKDQEAIAKAEEKRERKAAKRRGSQS